MRTRLFTIMLAAAMFSAMIPGVGYGNASAKTTGSMASDRDTFNEIAVQVRDSNDDPFDYRKGEASLKSMSNAYPESYDLRSKGLVTPVKFQNPFGTCWGFAAIAAAETSILGNPQVRGSYTADTLNLSEKHLAFFLAQAIDDPNDPQYGEGFHTDPGLSLADKFDMGGFTFLATNLFASGVGPVVEDDGDEHPTLRYRGENSSKEFRIVDGKLTEYCYDEEDDWSLPEEYRYLHTFDLRESFILPCPAHVDMDTGEYEYNPDGTRAIKKMLLKDRAVQIGFCADTSSPSQEAGDGLYISTNWAHYTYDSEETANHCVTIVGWDDNYPKENFIKEHQPPEKGAWLVKNSWGSEEEDFPNKGPGWGIENEKGEHTGYFWLSYYDKTLESPEALEFDRNNELENDGVYVDAHDFMPPNDVEGAATDGETRMANVFKARGCQLLEGVSCQTSYPGTKVISQIYLLPDDFKDPTDGFLVCTAEGEYEFGGFHKMALSSPVLIQKGQYYSIVQTQTIDSGEYAVNMPIAFNEMSSKAMGMESWVVGVINKKESYLYVDGKWNDYSDQAFIDKLFEGQTQIFSFDSFPIKGYCKMQPDISIKVTGDTVFDLYEAKESLLRVSFKGTDGYAVTDEIEWKLSDGGADLFTVIPDEDDPFRARVIAGDVGRANLYITVKGAGTTVVPLSVNKKELMGATIVNDTVVYNGKAHKPAVYVEDAEGMKVDPSHYNVKYRNNVKCGQAQVTVTAKADDPVYSGIQELGFTIKPARATIKGLKAGKNKLMIRVKSQKASGAKSYEVSYRPKGASSWKKKTFKASSGKLVLKKLKKGKKYQVKVRAKAAPLKDTGFENAGRYSTVKTSKKIR